VVLNVLAPCELRPQRSPKLKDEKEQYQTLDIVYAFLGLLSRLHSILEGLWVNLLQNSHPRRETWQQLWRASLYDMQPYPEYKHLPRSARWHQRSWSQRGTMLGVILCAPANLAQRALVDLTSRHKHLHQLQRQPSQDLRCLRKDRQICRHRFREERKQWDRWSPSSRENIWLLPHRKHHRCRNQTQAIDTNLALREDFLPKLNSWLEQSLRIQEDCYQAFSLGLTLARVLAQSSILY